MFAWWVCRSLSTVCFHYLPLNPPWAWINTVVSIYSYYMWENKSLWQCLYCRIKTKCQTLLLIHKCPSQLLVFQNVKMSTFNHLCWKKRQKQTDSESTFEDVWNSNIALESVWYKLLHYLTGFRSWQLTRTLACRILLTIIHEAAGLLPADTVHSLVHVYMITFRPIRLSLAVLCIYECN